MCGCGLLRVSTSGLAGAAGGASAPEFRFSVKVTDEITLHVLANFSCLSSRAGQVNAHFLDGTSFVSAFLELPRAIRERIGMILFKC